MLSKYLVILIYAPHSDPEVKSQFRKGLNLRRKERDDIAA